MLPPGHPALGLHHMAQLPTAQNAAFIQQQHALAAAAAHQGRYRSGGSRVPGHLELISYM